MHSAKDGITDEKCFVLSFYSIVLPIFFVRAVFPCELLISKAGITSPIVSSGSLVLTTRVITFLALYILLLVLRDMMLILYEVCFPLDAKADVFQADRQLVFLVRITVNFFVLLFSECLAVPFSAQLIL